MHKASDIAAIDGGKPGASTMTSETAEQSRTWWARQKLLAMPRYHKRLFLSLTDFAVLSAILWVLLCLRYNTFYVPDSWGAFLLAVLAPTITVAAFWFGGLYKLVTRYLGSRGNTKIAGCVAGGVLVWSLIVFMSGQLGIPRMVIVAYGFAATGAAIGIRHIAGWFLRTSGVEPFDFPPGFHRRPVMIYGAGHLGLELYKAVQRVHHYEAVGFVDNTPSLWGQYIAGLKVYRPERLPGMIERGKVEEILIALPNSERNERRLVLKELERLPVDVKILPSLEDLATGRVAVSDLRPIEVEDLLGRDPVPPNAALLARNLYDKNILVTGAGGSVGSELVRQILKQKPRRLVLFDVSEVALYEIGSELQELIAALPPEMERPEIIAVLGSVLDAELVERTLRTHAIDTVYHAAAYKHVPIVEMNAVAGLNNNIFGTLILAIAAEKVGVERVVLISTDKAVRPTSVMGASKRFAELVLQARATVPSRTVFTMVRFGNVLDSSGSVVKRFRRQIKSGGPVTVTHPEVIRYFMSIPEAAELVIQAGAMAKGGEVFVLDMGEPVKIDELARLMVRLFGFEVRDESNPDGDIQIVYTGLRTGEKLYEELLIGANTTGTEHPRILRSDEPALAVVELDHELGLLKAAMATGDIETIQAVLGRTVEGYCPERATVVSEATRAATWISPSRTLH